MKALTILIAAVLLFPSAGLAAGPLPRIQIDDDGPSMGVRTLDLVELWRVGGEDEDVIFGRVVDVKRHPNGDIHILDNQMCQVVVISSGGEHLRDLSRQGDGPGELRQPMGIVYLPDDILGVGMGFPGKLVTMGMDGTPKGTDYPIGEPSDGNVGVMISINYIDGFIVASGGRIVFEGPDSSHVLRFLSVSEPGQVGFNPILEKTTPIDPTGRRFVEADDYYIDQSWALGPGGTIFAPMERDAYEISAFDRKGELLHVFGRKYDPRKRNEEDKAEVSPLINVGSDPNNRDWDIADHDPAVSRIMIDPDDSMVWVLTPNGSNNQPEGIFETWDVFSMDGEFLRQVALPLGDEIRDGSSYLVGGNRLVVVRGTGSAFSGDDNLDEDEVEEEVEPLEVICYEIR